MDGRVQQSVTEFARCHFAVEWVDMVTEAGAVVDVHANLLRQVGISLDAHQSCGVVVAAHEGCVGNPVGDEKQRQQCLAAAQKVAAAYPETQVVAVWVGLDGNVETIS